MVAYTEKKYGLKGKILSKTYFGIEVIKDLTGYRGAESVLKEKQDSNIL